MWVDEKVKVKLRVLRELICIDEDVSDRVRVPGLAINGNPVVNWSIK